MSFKNFRISEKLSNLPTLPLGQLTELQGELKELSTVNYQKLKRSIEDKGFIVPVFVWQEPETAVNYICDGHQRSRCLIKEKVSLDTPIPVVFIEAKGILEAKEALLVISSQYGLITQEGYDTFTFDLDEAYLQEMVNFDALKVWEEEVSNTNDINEENYDTGQMSENGEVTCPKCGHVF